MGLQTTSICTLYIFLQKVKVYSFLPKSPLPHVQNTAFILNFFLFKILLDVFLSNQLFHLVSPNFLPYNDLVLHGFCPFRIQVHQHNLGGWLKRTLLYFTTSRKACWIYFYIIKKTVCPPGND